MHPILIIGYGNELRGDDAIGPKTVNAIEAWQIPSVRTLAVHQLTPELAEIIASAALILFVDACRFNCPETVRITLIEAVGPMTTGSTVPTMGHSSDPQSLLALAQSVYGHHPRAWGIEVPAVDFSMGEHLSATAEQGIADALDAIQNIILAQQLKAKRPLCTK